MTALEIAMAGCLAFGQPTGNYYEAITTHSGLQVIHSDGTASLMGHTFANGWTLDYLAVFWIGVAALSVVFTLAAGRCGSKR